MESARAKRGEAFRGHVQYAEKSAPLKICPQVSSFLLMILILLMIFPAATLKQRIRIMIKSMSKNGPTAG
jgi:hypothetical protein